MADVSSAAESTLIVLSSASTDVRAASALQSAASALGHANGAALIQLNEVDDLKRFVFEADPWAVMAIDDTSIAALREAFGLADQQFAPDVPAEVTGYTLVAIPGFAECLDDPDAKRVAWTRMRAAVHPGNPLD